MMIWIVYAIQNPFITGCQKGYSGGNRLVFLTQKKQRAQKKYCLPAMWHPLRESEDYAGALFPADPEDLRRNIPGPKGSHPDRDADLC